MLVPSTRIIPVESDAFVVLFRCSDVSLPASALLTDQEDPESNKDSHQCKRDSTFGSFAFPIDKLTLISL